MRLFLKFEVYQILFSVVMFSHRTSVKCIREIKRKIRLWVKSLPTRVCINSYAQKSNSFETKREQLQGSFYKLVWVQNHHRKDFLNPIKIRRIT